MKSAGLNMTSHQLLLVLATVTVTLAGCRKDLCYNHDEHSMSVKTYVDPTWEQEWERNDIINWEERWDENWSREYDEFRPEIATGIRCIAYDENEKAMESNLDDEGGRLPLAEGEYSLLFYNNDTEYIVFDQTTASATATATTRTRTRSGFADLHDGERTITPPDMLYGAYVRQHVAQKTWEPVSLPIEMRPLTYSYLIRYRFKSGQQYIAAAKGALAGMAEKVYLRDGHTDSSAATMMFDCKVDELGCTALLQAFGAPDYSYTEGYTADPETHHYTLSLEVVLHNGKRLPPYVFDISQAMRIQPRGGVIQVVDLEVSDEDGTEGGSGFDPDVDGWEDEIDIELPLN